MTLIVVKFLSLLTNSYYSGVVLIASTEPLNGLAGRSLIEQSRVERCAIDRKSRGTDSGFSLKLREDSIPPTRFDTLNARVARVRLLATRPCSRGAKSFYITSNQPNP